MKIFISWSSDSKESQDLAKYLKDWIDLIFPTQVELFISTEISKGSPGFCEIIEQLKGADLGIICLSKKNMNNCWINFEAGALLTKKPCTILIDLNHSEVQNPLGQLQGTLLKRDDIWKLIQQINEKLPISEEKSIDIKKLEQIFEQMFPIFLEKIDLIQKSLIESADSAEMITEEMVTETLHVPGIQYNVYQP